MNLRKDTREQPRRTPLVAALLLAGCCGSAAASSSQTLAVAMPQGAGRGAGVVALMQTLRDASAQQHRGARLTGAGVLPVTSCADDGSSGTLRAVIATAASGDIVELGALTCSVITLSQGALAVKPDSLTIHGPGAQKLAIDGAAKDRVFVHYGTDTLTISALTVRNGSNLLDGYKVAGGACIIGGSYVTLDHSIVTGCIAVGEGAYGGALLARGITLYTSTLDANFARGNTVKSLTAAYGGGAFAYRGTAALYDSIVSGNRADIDPANSYGSYDTGGGLFTDNGAFVLRSTIAGNYTDGTGGGIASHGPLLITNSTLTGNTAKRKPGGGLFLRSADLSALHNSTITLNVAPLGGGMYVSGTAPSLQLDSTILSGNSPPSASDIAAKSPLAVVGANNLIVAAGTNVTLPADTLRSDPRLRPLANNGGPTPTHALSPGSPAIDRGNNTAGLDTDQRGADFPRTIGNAPDIGAFEAAAIVAAVPTAAPALGVWALGLLVALIGWLGARAPIFTRRSPLSLHSSQM